MSKQEFRPVQAEGFAIGTVKGLREDGIETGVALVLLHNDIEYFFGLDRQALETTIMLLETLRDNPEKFHAMCE